MTQLKIDIFREFNRFIFVSSDEFIFNVAMQLLMQNEMKQEFDKLLYLLQGDCII